MDRILMKFRGYTFGFCRGKHTYKVTTPGGHSDWPIFYGFSGRRVGYNKPELIPGYIQKEIKRIYYG